VKCKCRMNDNFANGLMPTLYNVNISQSNVKMSMLTLRGTAVPKMEQ